MDYIWLEQSLRAYSFFINQSFFASILTTSSLSYMLMSNTCVIYSLLYIIHEYLMYMSANTPNAPICALYVLLITCICSQGSFISHRTHRFNRAFLRTVSISQNAFGIQISQSVTAKDGCKVL